MVKLNELSFSVENLLGKICQNPTEPGVRHHDPVTIRPAKLAELLEIFVVPPRELGVLVLLESGCFMPCKVGLKILLNQVNGRDLRVKKLAN